MKKKIEKGIFLALLSAMLANAVEAQDPTPECADTAYVESCSTTRWSAYVPVAALVLAALILSRADKREHCSSSSSHHSHSDSSSYSSPYYSSYYYFPSGSYSYSSSSYSSGSYSPSYSSSYTRSLSSSSRGHSAHY